MWIGSRNGLSRLEGDSLHRYPGQRTPGLGDGHVQRLHALANGDLLVGLDRGGLVLWSALRDSFTPVLPRDGVPLTGITTLRPASDGGVWVGADQGLFHWQGPGARLSARPWTGAETVAPSRVRDVLEQPGGELWLATHRGLLHRADAKAAFLPVQTGTAALDQRLASEPIERLAADPDGAVWIALSRGGVVVVPRTEAVWMPHQTVEGVEERHELPTIRSLYWAAGRMWAGSDGGGLWVVDGKQARQQTVLLDSLEGGRSLLVSDLTQSADTRLWMATDRGAFHVDPDPQAVRELDATLPGQPGGDRSVSSVVVDARQRLWMGMRDGVVQVLDPAAGTRRVVSLPPPLDGGPVMAMADDGQGRIWVAGHGASWIDRDTLQPRAGGVLPGTGNRRFTAVTTAVGRVWLGHADGVLELDAEGRQARALVGTSTGLTVGRVQSLAWHADDLWVGTVAGLHVVDGGEGRARVVALPGPREKGGARITSLLSTVGGLVVGHSDGLTVLPDDGGSPEVWSGALAPAVHSLASDRKGGVWFTLSPTGIGHRNAAGRIRLAGVRDGLFPDMELQHGLAASDAEGNLLAATSSGVVRVSAVLADMSEPAIPDLVPQLVSVLLDGQPLPPDHLPGVDRPWSVPAGVERVELSFAARDYLAPGLRHYSYRLEGGGSLGSEWIPLPDSAPVVLYSPLQAGRYTLAMRTTSEEFPGREWISTLALDVAPVWYARTSVRLTVVLVVGLTLWGLLRLRGLNQRRHRLLLERTIEMRTSELRLANERLDRLAGEDALTGLYNRRRMFERLAELHARRLRMSGVDVLVLLDLDHFKRINDRHGHLAGDAVLREVARRIRSGLRTVDLASRYGGEELLLVLPDTELVEAARVVERLAQSLRASPVAYGNLWIPVQASFGLALLDSGQPLEDSLGRADAALYQAKALGRDRVCVGA